MSGDERRVSLTVNQILELAGLVDREREKIRRMIDEHPSEKSSNIHRRSQIEKLDRIHSALMATIG
jgi:hypothetical protein